MLISHVPVDQVQEVKKRSGRGIGGRGLHESAIAKPVRLRVGVTGDTRCFVSVSFRPAVVCPVLK